MPPLPGQTVPPHLTPVLLRKHRPSEGDYVSHVAARVRSHAYGGGERPERITWPLPYKRRRCAGCPIVITDEVGAGGLPGPGRRRCLPEPPRCRPCCPFPTPSPPKARSCYLRTIPCLGDLGLRPAAPACVEGREEGPAGGRNPYPVSGWIQLGWLAG